MKGIYIVKITQVCKLGLEKPLLEMARVGFFDEYEIYIHTDLVIFSDLVILLQDCC